MASDVLPYNSIMYVNPQLHEVLLAALDELLVTHYLYYTDLIGDIHITVNKLIYDTSIRYSLSVVSTLDPVLNYLTVNTDNLAKLLEKLPFDLHKFVVASLTDTPNSVTINEEKGN